MGATHAWTWQHTLTHQPHDMCSADFVVLFLTPAGAATMNPHVRTHAVAAVRQDADWYLLDSQHPGVAHRLDCAALACSFDAEAVYLVTAEGEGQVLSAAAVCHAGRTLSSAIGSGATTTA